MTTTAKVHLRWMIRPDLDQVLAIDRGSFPEPWTDKDFLAYLRHDDCIGTVAEAAGIVVGFAIYELRKHALFLVTLAVHPAWRRRGVGGQMLAKLVSKLSGHRRTHLRAAVRESNLAAQLFLRASGFRATGVERDYFGGEDAYLMEVGYAKSVDGSAILRHGR